MATIYDEIAKGHAYVDWDGKVYTDRKEYVNAPASVLDEDLVWLFLWNGERTPQNEKERKLAASFAEMKAKGITNVEFPFS